MVLTSIMLLAACRKGFGSHETILQRALSSIYAQIQRRAAAMVSRSLPESSPEGAQMLFEKVASVASSKGSSPFLDVDRPMFFTKARGMAPRTWHLLKQLSLQERHHLQGCPCCEFRRWCDFTTGVVSATGLGSSTLIGMTSVR